MPLELPILNTGHVQRCFQICFNSNYATTFLHSSDGKIVFVTVAHAVEGAQSGDNFLLRQDQGWATFEVKHIEVDNVNDIAIYTLRDFIVSNLWQEPEVMMMLAHPLVYLGFPHRLHSDYPAQNEFVTPLAKTAHFSGNTKINGASLMILDGLNNPGFSGSPVFHKQYKNDKPEVGLVGMIHGFRYEQEEYGRVFRRAGPDGKEITPEKELFVRLNSGIILASHRKHIEDMFCRIDVGLDVQGTLG